MTLLLTLSGDQHFVYCSTQIIRNIIVTTPQDTTTKVPLRGDTHKEKKKKKGRKY